MTHRTMPRAVADRIRADLADSPAAARAGELDRAWALLEEAHILSQPWARNHVRVHAAMLGLAWRTRDAHEIRGQVLRLIVAGPGSLSGRYPLGNSGRSNVSATLPMPVAPELADLLREARG